MSKIYFTIEIVPQSTQNGNNIGRSANGKAFVYSNKRKGAYQSMVAALAWKHRPSQPFTGPIIMSTTFIMPRPKSMMIARYADGLIPMAKRPDRDNLQKGTQDALSRCGFWLDDGQIFDGSIRKYYAEKTGVPRISVELEEIQL